MNKDQMREIVVMFCRQMRKVWSSMDLDDIANSLIVLSHDELGWQLLAIASKSREIEKDDDIAFVMPMPILVSDSTEDAVIEMGMILYARLLGYFAKVKASASRRPEARRRSAKKAAAARWAKKRKMSQ